MHIEVVTVGSIGIVVMNATYDVFTCFICLFSF